MKSQQTLTNGHSPEPVILIAPIAVALLVGIVFIGLLSMITFAANLDGATFTQKLQSIFALNSVQSWWYVTRASGLTAYLLLWLSMIWGLAIPSKIIQPILEGAFTYDFHEYLSLLGLGFVILHVVVLMLDKYLPFSLLQILIPFTDTYRPLWVGLGIIGFYLFLLVTVTFYVRTQIGTQMFRAIHVLSLAGYLGTTLHGLFAGTDSALPIAKFLYMGTFLMVILLTIYWMVTRASKRYEQDEATTVVSSRERYRRQQARRSKG